MKKEICIKRSANVVVLTFTLLFSFMSNVYAGSFSGQVEGNVFTMVNLDGGSVAPTVPTVQLFIVGMKVQLLKKDAFADTIVADGFTGESGAFSLEFDETDNASEIELYLKFIASNGNNTIRVRKKLVTGKVTRSETFLKSSPIVVQDGIPISENFDAIELDNDQTKPQLLHWANRSQEFVLTSQSVFEFPVGAGLDILTLPVGGQTPFFFPGGYRAELIDALIALHGISVTAVAVIFPQLGVILGNIGVVVEVAIAAYVDTQLSATDTIYISETEQLNENTIYHEFGHFLMWYLQDKSWLNPIDASFSRHFTSANAPNSKLAWTEGFPNGFAMIVDAWSRLDDGEYGFDGISAYEDRTMRELENVAWAIDCTSAGSTCNDQAMSHGYVSEWYVGTTLYDLWDGSQNLQLRAPPVAPEEHEDPTVSDDTTFPILTTANDQVELSFANIIQPLLNNQGTGGFHTIFNNQEQLLINDFIQYHEELMALNITLPPDDNEECRIDREMTGLFHYNGIRNLHSSLNISTFPDLLSADFLNTDSLFFNREVETEFYIFDDGQGTFVPEKTVFQTFSVDVTELVDSNDKFNYSSQAVDDINGVLSDDLLVSGTVTGGSAVLSFNNRSFYGWQSISNNYNMPLSFIMPVEDVFSVSLCGGMTMEVNEAGKIVVGSSITIHSAQVTLESGGELILGGNLGSKGELVINANSRLVIEKDATLRINPGAVIKLIGANAVLEIRGNLVISAGAEFRYISSDGGYVLFNLPDNGGEPNVVLEPSSKITLEEVPFKIAENSYIRPDDILGPEFTIKNATGFFRENAYIDVSQSLFTLEQSTIMLDDGASSHKGIILNGANHRITQSTISGGYPGIYDSNTSGDISLSIDTTHFFSCGTAIEVVDLNVSLKKVRFSYNQTGLKTVRGRADLFRTEFLNNSNGWWAIEHSQASKIRGGAVAGNSEYGLRIEAQVGSKLSLNKVTFLRNEVAAWIDGPGSFSPKKSKFNSSQKKALLLSNGALLIMNNNAGNVFSRNPVSVDLQEAAVPALFNGHNNFFPFLASDDGLTFSGTIASNIGCVDPDIPAGGNNWHSSFSQIPSIALANGPYDISSSSGCIYMLIP